MRGERGEPRESEELGRGGRSERGRADLILVRRALRGNQDAHDELTRRLTCLPRILRSIAARGGARLSDSDFQDLVQDTALAIWRKLDHFDGRGALETWAYRFCTLELFEKFRSVARYRGRHTDLGEGADGPVDGSPTDPVVDVEAALGLLEEDELDVVRLKHYEDATFERIGERLAISSNTAKTRYYRGLMKLREHLLGRYPDLFGEARS